MAGLFGFKTVGFRAEKVRTLSCSAFAENLILTGMRLNNSAQPFQHGKYG